jgi:hypothetical protein
MERVLLRYQDSRTSHRREMLRYWDSSIPRRRVLLSPRRRLRKERVLLDTRTLELPVGEYC